MIVKKESYMLVYNQQIMKRVAGIFLTKIGKNMEDMKTVFLDLKMRKKNIAIILYV